METHKSVMLPEHLWRALDDMSKDGAQHADLLVRLAVEQFVALQGYDVPPAQRARPAAPAPQPAPQAAPAPAAQPAPAAKAPAPAPPPGPAPAARPAPKAAAPAAAPDAAPVAKLRPAAPPPNPNPTPPAPAPLMDDDDDGDAATRVRMPSGQSPAMAGPAVTDASPAHKPQATVTEPPTMGGPEWIKRIALADTDSDRTAARERMLAIENEIAKLTLERPTTAPLTEAASGGDDEEEAADQGDEDAGEGDE